MDEKILYRNPVKALGFAMVPHVVTADTSLSDGAYRLYVALLGYAQQKNACWPSQDTLMDHLGRGHSIIAERTKELQAAGLITRQLRRGSVAITWIEDVEQIARYKDSALATLKARGETAYDAPESGKVSTSEPEKSGNFSTLPQTSGKPDLLTSGKPDVIKNNKLEEEQDTLRAAHCAARGPETQVTELPKAEVSFIDQFLSTETGIPVQENSDTERVNAQHFGPSSDAPGKDTTMQHRAVKMVRGIVRLTPNRVQRAEIIERVTDYALWEQVLKAWMLAGYKPTNIAGMLAAYTAGGLKDLRTTFRPRGETYHNHAELTSAEPMAL